MTTLHYYASTTLSTGPSTKFNTEPAEVLSTGALKQVLLGDMYIEQSRNAHVTLSKYSYGRSHFLKKIELLRI